MESFASVEDYVARFGSVADEELLKELLMDATRLIASELELAGCPTDDEEHADIRMQVCRSVAFRSMEQSDSSRATVPFGATQFSQGAGSYTESFTIGNPYRDIYLTKAEKRLLGVGRMRLGFIGPSRTPDEDD